MDRYPMTKKEVQDLEVANLAFTVMFALEMIL